ncbi:UNKNOWN [Stylonychia lemnae]|uniref:Uncharacterized protein n=1 Tax=Stylonychia lemnae TaxID=5949 RepID=A0A078AQL2_STYLE|nr:UNKNOWN [Stylonychia lemnae]|eukprot:CDW83203.1 UNKNOWN [Stylonychia lemnae]
MRNQIQITFNSHNQHLQPFNKEIYLNHINLSKVDESIRLLNIQQQIIMNRYQINKESNKHSQDRIRSNDSSLKRDQSQNLTFENEASVEYGSPNKQGILKQIQQNQSHLKSQPMSGKLRSRNNNIFSNRANDYGIINTEMIIKSSGLIYQTERENIQKSFRDLNFIKELNKSVLKTDINSVEQLSTSMKNGSSSYVQNNSSENNQDSSFFRLSDSTLCKSMKNLQHLRSQHFQYSTNLKVENRHQIYIRKNTNKNKSQDKQASNGGAMNTRIHTKRSKNLPFLELKNAQKLYFQPRKGSTKFQRNNNSLQISQPKVLNEDKTPTKVYSNQGIAKQIRITPLNMTVSKISIKQRINNNIPNITIQEPQAQANTISDKLLAGKDSLITITQI